MSKGGIPRQLFNACSAGNLDVLLQIKYHNPDEVTNILLGPDPLYEGDAADQDFLHVACKNGHFEIVRNLVGWGADKDALGSEDVTPLCMACTYGHLEIAKFLVTSNATIYSAELGQSSPIIHACVAGQESVVGFLLSVKPALIQTLGQSMLYTACKEGHLDIVSLLIKKGVEINPPHLTAMNEENFEPSIFPGSPLKGACDGRQIAVVQYLIENGATVSQEIIEGSWEVLEEVLVRATHVSGARKKTSVSFEVDPSVTLLEATWNRRGLCALHKAWVINLSAQLVNINLSYNQIQQIPEELLNVMPVLECLDLSHNQLTSVPEITNASYMRLQKVSVNHNQLVQVPASLFQVQSLKKLDFSHNQIKSLAGGNEASETSADVDKWACTSLKVFQLSHNALEHLPVGIYGSTGLVKLFVDHNDLKAFPTAWKCPLETLDLSHNKLPEFFCNVEMVWSASLQQLNLSYNCLDEISSSVCQLSALRELDYSHNALRRLPDVGYWKCGSLHKLNLGHNKLAAKPETATAGRRLRGGSLLRTSQEETEIKTDAELPDTLFSHTLEMLQLNDNFLQTVPASVCRLTSVIELDLSNNPDLRTLPPELGRLVDCYHLKLLNLNLKDLPKRARPGEPGVRAKDTLAYLRAKLRKSVPYYRMKLMVVGKQGRGKTTLLAVLRGEKVPDNISTVGIVVSEWQVQTASGGRFKFPRFTKDESPTVTFSTWDLAGQNVYYPAHQMFLSPNTLYLAVWNVINGEEGVDNLRTWLLNIQARAPGSDVVIVGTHADQLPRDTRPEREMALKQSILQKYTGRGFPNIVSTIFVSPVTGENIAELKELIYNKAVKAKDRGEVIIGRMVPQSYILLQEAVMREAERRRAIGEPPILMEEEMLELARANPENDICDSEELTRATRFLHENGVLLHYNDQLRGLNLLYFIDPSWVCDLIAALVTVRERNPFVKNGVMKMSDVEVVLKDPRFPRQFIPQYLQLTERFEIALALDDKRLLMPSMLPRERPGINFHKQQTLLCKRRASAERPKEPGTIRRLYQMMYVPSGFWSRLITRLMVSIQRWRSIEGVGDDSYALIFWREGLGVVHDFLIESFSEMAPLQSAGMRREHQEGISVTVWSLNGDFSSIGFIVDQIDALISEWYPGLDETDKFGYPLVRRLIPCPRCEFPSQRSKQTASLRRSTSMEFPSCMVDSELPALNQPYLFTLPTCAAVALDFEYVSCPHHPSQPVHLKDLIPDLMLTDLPDHLLIKSSELQYQPTDASRLGSGGSGEVFKGSFRGQPVAVKTFHSTRNVGHALDSGLGGTGPVRFNSNEGSVFHGGCITEGSSFRRKDIFHSSAQEENIEEELEKTKVVRAFWDLRQEVAVLCRLDHPCVVRLMGVCLRPLCFVLELAPHGSLSAVLEDALLSRDAAASPGTELNFKDSLESPLGRGLTYKIAHQIASALWYLHDCDIIYRDLKADNVLVWSLDETSLINVKVSDYGISCFATPQGVAGEEGTPGYQAPEIRAGIGYDEKVDIFSFGILLFEILSGLRPFAEFRSAVDIKKAVRRGVRPSLDDCSTRLPRLEHMMRSCWHALPEHRPSAEQILKEMSEPSFLCQCRLMPSPEEGVLEKVTAIFGVTHSAAEGAADGDYVASSACTSYVLLWSRERKQRTFSVVNCDNGVFQASSQSCPGHRVLCMCRVGNRTWLGTEGCAIDVFGRKSAWGLPTTLWSYRTKAAVLALLAEESAAEASAARSTKETQAVKRVFASLANGTLVVISRRAKNGKCRWHADVTRVAPEDDALVPESCEWSDTRLINLSQKGNPATSLVLVDGGRELWVGCANKIVVVDCSTLEVVCEICVFRSERTHVRIMVTDGQKVWSADRHSTQLLQWNVHTRQLTHIFDCDVSAAGREVICQPVEQPAGETRDENATRRDGGAEGADASADRDASRNAVPCLEEDGKSDSHGVPSTPPVGIPGRNPSSEAAVGSMADSGVASECGLSVGAHGNDLEQQSANPDPGFELVDPIEARAAALKAKRSDSAAPNRTSRTFASMKELGGEASTLRRGPSMMRSRKRKSQRQQEQEEAQLQRPWAAQPRLRISRGSVNKVTALLLVEGTLWVGRGVGDILVVNVDSECQSAACPYGQVMTNLHTENLANYANGQIDEIVHTGGNKVVCRRRLESVRARSPTRDGYTAEAAFGTSPPGHDEDPFTERYQLIEWEAWGVREFQQFKKHMEEFDKLVD